LVLECITIHILGVISSLLLVESLCLLRGPVIHQLVQRLLVESWLLLRAILASLVNVVDRGGQSWRLEAAV